MPRKVEIHWIPPERNRWGEITKPGYHTQKQVWVEGDADQRGKNPSAYHHQSSFITRPTGVTTQKRGETHGTAAGTFWTYVLAIAGIIFIFWVTSLFIDDGPAGKCQGELGYMGQVENVECEPSE